VGERTREIQNVNRLVAESISAAQTRWNPDNEKVRSIQDAKKIAK
jgi:hypothetical protein